MLSTKCCLGMRARWGSKRSLHARSLEFHDLGFFVLQERVDLSYVAVGELLNVLLRAAIVVLGDLLVLQQLLEIGQRLATHAAHGDASVLGLVPHDSHELLAALLDRKST